jgi:hypothetical protein
MTPQLSLFSDINMKMRTEYYPFHRAGAFMHQPFSASLVLFALFALVALSPPPTAAQVELNPSHPDTYMVRSGDTLWDIAGRFLRDPWRWPQIWDSNRELGDPNRIYPGDVLRLYYRDGRPLVGRESAPSAKTPVSTIPVEAIRPFLTRAYVLDRSEIDRAPYIVAFPDEHIVAGSGDFAYVRSIGRSAGGRYDIVRPGETLRDPDTGTILGYKARFIAAAVLERSGDPAKVRIADVALEVGIGDRVLSSKTEKPFTDFSPRPGRRGVRGRIISVLDGVSQIGQYNVVVLDFGSKDGVRPGHVFEVFNGGETVRDLARSDELRRDWKNQRFWSEETWFGDHRTKGWMPEGIPGPDFPPHTNARRESGSVVLPYERAGVLMVFRTFDRVSFALIMNATRPMFLLDAVRPPPA